MRTPAGVIDQAASRIVVRQLWAAWLEACPPGERPTVAGFASGAGVNVETLRVLVRTAEDGTIRSGPGFLTVARLAQYVGADLNQLAREALQAASAT